jgi:FKBP-type peptidyl-prolyl cis-trans isomerase (trigger factor)
MKVQVQSKKGLKTTLSIIVDKAEIKKKLENRLLELQTPNNINCRYNWF